MLCRLRPNLFRSVGDRGRGLSRYLWIELWDSIDFASMENPFLFSSFLISLDRRRFLENIVARCKFVEENSFGSWDSSHYPTMNM